MRSRPSHKDPATAVLDSTAILAVMFNESGGELVVPMLGGGLLGAVNLAEVHARLLSRGADGELAWRLIGGLGCEICAFDDRQARIAAELESQTRSLRLSFAARACLALAIVRKATVYTADAAWQDLDLGLEIKVIR